MEHNTINREIGLRVSGAIEQAGTSRKRTAEAVGIPVSTFNRKLKGDTAFFVPEILKLARHLSVEFDELVPVEMRAVA